MKIRPTLSWKITKININTLSIHVLLLEKGSVFAGKITEAKWFPKRVDRHDLNRALQEKIAQVFV